MSAYHKNPEWNVELPDFRNWKLRGPDPEDFWTLLVFLALALWLIYNSL